MSVVTMHVDYRDPDWQWHGTASLVAASDRIGPPFRDLLKRAAPVGQAPNDPRPGRLRDSIRYSRNTTGGAVRMSFTAHVPYAKYVLGGTTPHLIEPRAARALHWFDGGGDRFAMRVHHPGTAPNRFPGKALDEARTAIIGVFYDQLRGVR